MQSFIAAAQLTLRCVSVIVRLKMASRLDADRVLAMMSDIDTEPDTDAELEEQVYSESESESAASNSEVSDSSSDDGNVSGSEETNSGTDSEDQSEGPVTNTRRGGRARVRGSRRGRGRGRGRVGRGGRVGIRGRREGRRGRGRRGTRSTEEALYNWTTVTGGKKMYKNKNIRITVFSSTADTPPQTAAFTAQPGPKVDTSCKTPEEFFSIFFDDNLLDFIVENTNKYAQKMSSMQLTTFCLYRNWRPVTRAEMKGFLVIILNMGIIQLGDLKDYWSTDNTTNLPFFRSVFSCDRFFQIFGALHVGEIDSTTKRGKIQPFLDKICPTFEAAFTPGRQISIDESVITFKGRVSFRQYLKGKPNPWGIKAFVLADSKTGYMNRLRIYYGKETQLIDRPLPHTVKVVMTLAEPFHNQGYDLYLDRFYGSPLLATELTKVGITVTGTVQANRKGLPKDITAKRKEPTGTVRAARSGNMLALSWVDKRKVLMLSTKHSNTVMQVRSR